MTAVKLEVTLFGSPHFRLDGAPVPPFALRKTQALLVYLVCHERPISRDLLVGMFWPDKREADARNNLRRVLPDLRKQFGPFLHSDHQTITFVRRPPFWLDVDELLAAQHLWQRGAPLAETAADQLEAALRLYTGEFLAGLNLPDAPAFEDWLLMQREYLREQALTGLSALTEYFIQTGQVRRGLATTQQLLALEPWQESAYEQRMVLLAWNGDRTAALHLYDVCKQVLVDEFGLPPNDKITDLYERIKAGKFEPPSVSVQSAAHPKHEPTPLDQPSVADRQRAAAPSAGGYATRLSILPTKIAHPDYPAAMVDRPRLYRRLDDWRRLRGLAIFAQAGYGKSSLVSRWLDVAGLRGQTAWVNLDEDDADPARFVHYVAAALEGVRPGALELVQPILVDQRGTPSHALQHLLSTFEQLAPAGVADPHVLLVLDDWQLIQSPAVDALLLTMLEQGPPTLHLVILARHRTALRLARLHAQEKLAFLTVDDLRFTAGEVAAYLWAKGFDATTEVEMAELTARSEGWITALQLAVLSLRHPGDVGELIAALQGDHDWLAEYLVGEVLDRQTPELQRFLLETSILDEFNAPLCAAVTGDTSVYAYLVALARADLFLIHLNYGAGWSRYHHLFRELLHHRLKSQIDPARLADLHRNAARWLANSGRVPAAVRHFLTAGDEDAAADLVERQSGALLMSDPYEAKTLFDLLPAAIAQRRPRLMLDRFFIVALFNYKDDDLIAQQAKAAIEQCAGDPETMAAFNGEWLVLRSGACYVHGEYVAAERSLAQAEPYMATMPDHFAGLVAFIRMHLSNYAGDYAAALQWGDRALDAFRRTGFSLGIVAVQRELARWNMVRGESTEATRRFQALFDGWQHEQRHLNRDIILAQIFAAEHNYLLNQLEQAVAHLDTAQQLARQLQDDELIFLTARIGQVVQSQLYTSVAVDLPALQAPDRTLTPTWLDLLLETESRSLVAAGHFEEAWSLMQQSGLSFARTPEDYPRAALVAYLRAYIAHGCDLAGIGAFLAEAAAHFAGVGARLRQLQLLAFAAWQQLQVYGPEKAAETLAEAARLAKETGYVRVLLDIPALAETVAGAGDAARHAPAG